MPNLRGKTWTTTTPATVTDAQYWEDHLISDAAAAKAASSVQTVNNTAPDANGNINITPHSGGPTVIDSLNSTSATDALSANQGHVLKGKTDDIWSVMGENGAKNKLKIPDSVVTDTKNGVTFTVHRNSAGEVTKVVTSGTVEAGKNSAIFYLLGTSSSDPASLKLPSGDYILNGCPSGGGSSNYRIMLADRTASPTVQYKDDGSGVNVTVDDTHLYTLVLVVYPEQTESLTFYPMIRLTSDTDPTFKPYVMTNAELTAIAKVYKSQVTDIISGASAVENPLGNYLIRSGNTVQLAISITPVTAGANATLFKIPNGYKPVATSQYRNVSVKDLAGGVDRIYYIVNGEFKCIEALTNAEVRVFVTWITEDTLPTS